MAQKDDPHAWSRAARSGASDSEPRATVDALLLWAGKARARKYTTGASAPTQAGFCPYHQLLMVPCTLAYPLNKTRYRARGTAHFKPSTAICPVPPKARYRSRESERCR